MLRQQQKRRHGRREMHAERAVPAGTNFPKESFKGGTAAEKEAAELQKDLILLVRMVIWVR